MEGAKLVVGEERSSSRDDQSPIGLFHVSPSVAVRPELGPELSVAMSVPIR